jgi:4-hydroxyacetophenone monooxygenase
MLPRVDFQEAVSDAVRDEAALRVALAECDIAPMLMVLTQLSGDLATLDEVAPHIDGAWSFMETVPEALKLTVRDRLVSVLNDYAATDREPPKDLPAETLQRMMSAGVGTTVPAEYIPLLVEEADLNGNDSRAAHWHRRPDAETLTKYKVAIIGAGFSGLCMAIRLQLFWASSSPSMRRTRMLAAPKQIPVG